MLDRSRYGVFLALCAALLLLLSACSGPQGQSEEYRLGLMEPLSSPDRFTAYLVLQERVDVLNRQGGVEVGGRKMKIRLLVEDSGGTTEKTMSAMGKLVQQERVSGVIGPFYSREAIPVAAALETLRVPMLTPSATNPEVTRGRTFAFRVCQLDSDQGRALARYAHGELGLRRAAVLYDEADAYSSGLAGFFAEAFSTLPGGSVQKEPYPAGSTSFLKQLMRIRASGAQLLFLPNFPTDLAPQIQQARAAGFTGVLLGGDSWDTDHGFHSLPEVQGAIYSTDFAPAAADPARLAEAQAMAAKNGASLGKNAALTLDALDLFIAAARKVGSTDPVSLRSGLASLSGFEGLTGSISFTPGSGDPVRSTCLMEIQGGKSALRARLNPEPR
ncbi:MAG: ABC transporter substrate-binding protein [Desulfovibrio sp.]|jgi:branched-chain amino acid transport system substrate-binding protein|nr:ABC transporter substrate-binding protein [Desulfovibrio sp.]